MSRPFKGSSPFLSPIWSDRARYADRQHRMSEWQYLLFRSVLLAAGIAVASWTADVASGHTFFVWWHYLLMCGLVAVMACAGSYTIRVDRSKAAIGYGATLIGLATLAGCLGYWGQATISLVRQSLAPALLTALVAVTLYTLIGVIMLAIGWYESWLRLAPLQLSTAASLALLFISWAFLVDGRPGNIVPCAVGLAFGVWLGLSLNRGATMNRNADNVFDTAAAAYGDIFYAVVRLVRWPFARLADTRRRRHCPDGH